MSYALIIRHIQRIFNQCGDPVILMPTGQKILAENGQLLIEIRKVLIMRKNNCCTIPSPTPCSSDNPPDKYWINRIRVSVSLADDYSKGFPFTDDEIRNTISTKTFLFACYD